MKDAPSALALFLLVTSLAASARSTSGGLRGELKYRASSVPDQHSYLLAMPADQRAPLPAALVLSSGALVVAYRGVVEVFPKYDEHVSKRGAELPFQGEQRWSSHAVAELADNGVLVLSREARRVFAFDSTLTLRWSQRIPAFVLSMRMIQGTLLITGTPEDEHDLGRSVLAWSVDRGTWVHARDSLRWFRSEKDGTTRRHLAHSRFGADSVVWGVSLLTGNAEAYQADGRVRDRIAFPSSFAAGNTEGERVILRETSVQADGRLALLLWRERIPMVSEARPAFQSEIWDLRSDAGSEPTPAIGAEQVWIGITSDMRPIRFETRADSAFVVR